MLDDLLTDNVEVVKAENKPLFSTQFDFAEEKRRKDQATEEWKKLDQSKREEYRNNIKNYYKEKGVRDPQDPELYPSKNWHLLKNEASAQYQSTNRFELLPINDLHFEQSLLELVENIENVEHIRQLYKKRKLTSGKEKNSGINSKEASRLKNCLRQGRDLYISGKAGSLMVKPLNFFYSLTAYAYAIIILNNPIRFTLDAIPGSHGINYVPDGLKTQFGGDMPHGTFSDLFASHPTLFSKNRHFDIAIDNAEAILSFFSSRFTVNVGTLLSLIPEIREYYKLVTGRNSRTHPLEISLGNDPRNIKWEFQIGDGEYRPTGSEVENAFSGFNITERHGKVIVEVPAVDVHKISASIFVDIRGDFWFIENPFFPVILPEICVHFLLTNTFSNIMRYSPDHWGSILLNEVNSDVSLITRKYLSSFENKFPMLILRLISQYYPYVE